MKKFMLVFAMAATMMAGATVKAEGAVNSAANNANETAVVEENKMNFDSVNYKIRLRLRDLNKVMRLDADQVENLQFTCSDLNRRVSRLEKAPADERQARLMVIVTENLAAVHELVTPAQYRQYLAYLNQEFNKHGLNSVLFNDNFLAEK